MKHVFAGGGRFRWGLTPSEAPPADVSLLMLIACRLPDQPQSTINALLPLSSQPLQQGTALEAVGSPFGVTAPQHFVNMQYNGVVSQVIQVLANLGSGLGLAAAFVPQPTQHALKRMSRLL